MDNKYLRNKVLTIDDAARRRVRDLINEYASRSEGHPFVDYGNEIQLEKYELSPIYVVNLRSQFDHRHVEEKMRPYKNDQIYMRKYYRPSDVDVWQFNLLTTERFVHNGKSFEVTGSHHAETCTKCGGSGKMTCPACGGSGTQPCSSCNGNGQIKKTRSNYVHTKDKVYSDGHREPIYEYVTETYYVKCSNCGGSGEVDCYKCGGDCRVTCDICAGWGKNLFYYVIDQKLDDYLLAEYYYHPNVAKVAEIVDLKQDYNRVRLFHERSSSIPKGYYSEDGEFADKLDSFIGQHDKKTDSHNHILFQEAEVQRVEVWWVQYSYQGKTYDGCISQKNGKDYFYAGVSPITELADKWLKEAKKKLGGVGTVKARKILEQVEKLHVYGRSIEQKDLESKVSGHLNMLYNMGNDLMFWLIALVGTPFLFNFYSELNPVLRYAHFLNDPNWAPYGWVPVVQCILFLVLLWIAKVVIDFGEHSKERHATVFGYVLSGMGLYLLIAVGILAVMLGLNYLGLSVLTTGAFWLAWQVVKIALIVLVYAIMIGYALMKWLLGLLVKLWHFIF
ncbi:MAG: hypothetical protein K6F21_03965 [Bacteroidales bacterium]|nr:hypothetical protein [Bacteroidales bacterium]